MPSAALRQTVAKRGVKIEVDQGYAEGHRKWRNTRWIRSINRRRNGAWNAVKSSGKTDEKKPLPGRQRFSMKRS